MALTNTNSGTTGQVDAQEIHTFQADGQERIELPSADFIADAKMTRDGDNLVLEAPNGEIAVVEGYFSAEPSPLLQSADGATLTPNLVQAFSRSPLEFAANDSASDESPVGAVEEVKGNATVTRADGTVETITIGTPIYQGDVIETDAAGAVNIVFIDETSMAVSENARLAIDEYTFDPSTESGTTNFSVLRGLFVFTSGLIGRDDPDDVSIDTPVGSIGIRGTVIAGDINPSGESNITVLEGAIVVTNGSGETVLSEQFQTVRLGGFDQPMKDLGVLPANDIGTRFNSIGDVNPGLFTTINDAAKEQSSNAQSPAQQSQSGAEHAESGNADTSSMKEAAPAQAAPPVAPPPSVMDPGLATLDGNSTGLPSHNTITGQPANATPAAASIGTHDTSIGTVPPSPGTVAVAPPTPSVADQTALPPHSVVTTPATPVIVAPAISYTAANVTDLAGEHALIARISTSAGTSVTSYTITSANAAYFDIVTDSTGANITLTQAGMDFLGDSLDVRQLGAIAVQAVTADSQVLTTTGTTQVLDAHAMNQIINLNAANAPHVAIISDNLNNNVGYTIAALGDTNNDGFDDFAVSRDTGNTSQNFSTRILGTAGIENSGLLTSLPIGTLPNNTTASGNIYGTTLAGVGDFNGDGVEDYVVGQFGNDAGGIVGSGSAVIVNGNNTSQFIGFTSGISVSAQIGYSVAGAGDFNNDGYADVLIGSPGQSTVYFMRGLSTSWTGNISSQATLLTGDTGFGTSVAGIGDYNGDGYSDFVVGAPGAGGATNGSVRMFFGNGAGTFTASDTITGLAGQGLGEDVFGIGDINGDGRSDMIVGGNDNSGKIFFGTHGSSIGTAAVELDIPAGGPNNYVVTGGGGVGDFNGDGYSDFVIAIGDNTSTKAYVVYGKQDWSGTPVIDASYLKNPDNAHEIRYNGANNTHDIEVSGIGDINGDGYDDFAIGLPDANGSAAGNGGMAIIYGRNTGAVDRTGTNVAAENNGQALVGTDGNDQLSDGGFSGVSMRGGAGADTFSISGTNFLGIDGGGNTNAGLDTIRAMGNLDFTHVDFEKVSGIERLTFGDSNLTITLTMENLFNMLKSSSNGTLVIGSGGQANENLVLTDSNGADNYAGSRQDQMQAFLEDAAGGSTTVQHSSSGGFDTFRIGGYTLMVDQAIAVDAQ